MVNDALDEAIEIKRRECDEARSRLATLLIELQTLEHAASLRPASSEAQRTQPPRMEQRIVSRKGRKPGAISKKWREILSRVAVHYPEGARSEDIASYGPGFGLVNLRATDARQQAEKYVKLGLLEPAGDRYKVTSTARERFGFPSMESTNGDSSPPEERAVAE